jgi:hypothetical protein
MYEVKLEVLLSTAATHACAHPPYFRNQPTGKPQPDFFRSVTTYTNFPVPRPYVVNTATTL